MTHKIFALAVAYAVLAVFAISLEASDPAQGQVLSKQCTVCHGELGIARDPEVPNLAGQSAFYISKSLKEYQTGKRDDRRMTLMVENLSDQDIKDLGAWYESIQVTVSIPE